MDFTENCTVIRQSDGAWGVGHGAWGMGLAGFGSPPGRVPIAIVKGWVLPNQYPVPVNA